MIPLIKKFITMLQKVRSVLDQYVGRVWLHVIVIVFYLLSLKKLEYFSSVYTTRSSMIREGFVAVYIYYMFYAILKNTKVKYIVATIPILVLNLIMEIYYRSFGSAFKLISVKKVPELIEVSDFNISLLLIMVLVVPPIFILWSLDYKKRQKLAVGMFACSAFYFSIEVWPSAYLELFDVFPSKTNQWSDINSIQLNGRLSMLLYWEAQRTKALNNLKKVVGDGGLSADTALIRRSLQMKRNVHIVIMESFFDPTRMPCIKLSRPAMHPRLLEIFANEVGLSESPVFGGGTAQAEFEVLTGVPAFAEFGDIEFNLFGGSPTYSLPALLHGVGYKTQATNAYKPDFFNSDVAYRGLGFDKVYYPKVYTKISDTYIDNSIPAKEKYIFDGDLLTKNLDFFQRNKDTSRVPVLNYVIGMYGHYPFVIDYKKRPKVIDVEVPSGFDKNLIEMMVNQLYYRTEALATFVERLMTIDPNSIVVIIGDHLPNLEPVGGLAFGSRAYSMLGYQGGGKDVYHYSSIMVLDAGHPVKLNKFAHYNVPELVLNLLTKGEYCKGRKCFQLKESYRDRYNQIMSQAIK